MGKQRLLLSLSIIFFFFPLAFADTNKNIVSIFYFKNLAGQKDYDWLSIGLSDMLSTGLSSSRAIILVEREQLLKIFEEQKLSLAGLTDEKTAVSTGKLLSARYLITGSYSIQDSKLRSDVKILDVEKSTYESIQATGKMEDTAAVADELAIKALQKLDPELAPQAVSNTTAFDAIKNYYIGVGFLDSGEAGKALEKFNQAAAIDPFYTSPQRGIEEAYRFLKDFKKLRYQRELRGYYQKLEKLKSRLSEKPFRTYSDLLKDTDYIHMTAEERDRFNHDNQAYFSGDSPALVTWNIQMTLLEIYSRNYSFYTEQMNAEKNSQAATNQADKGKLREEQDQNKAAMEKLNLTFLREIIRIAQESRKVYQKDPNLNNILYSELLAYSLSKDYPNLKKYSESFMREYPDYRMIQAVEDFYQRALEKLEEGR